MAGTDDAPILEFDPAVTAVIEPSAVMAPEEGVPSQVVLCFFQEVVERVVASHGVRERSPFKAEHGIHPFWELEWEGRRFGVFHPGVGAPLAAGFLEEAIAKGCRSFVACGGAGALVPELTLGHVVVPTSAIRDEGTSYHYLPPSRSVAPSDAAVDAIRATLEDHRVPYVTGPTWTTDAPYRETRDRMRRRAEEGCLTVEMEAAGFFAVAAFRGVTFGQLLYAGDDLSGDVWDERAWLAHADGRKQLFWLAAEAALRL
ncbi:MAG: nucleoside phosphorylase [Actinomycetota bacterium]